MLRFKWLVVEVFWFIAGLFGFHRYPGKKFDLAALFQSVPHVSATAVPQSLPSKRDRALLKKWRETVRSAKKFVILYLDLSTSVESIASEYKSGYQFLLDEIRMANPYLLIFGFNAEVKLYYEGYAREAPRFDTAQFARAGKWSMLNYGTALFDSLVLGSRLVLDLSANGPVSAVWLTDGLDSTSKYSRLSDAAAACEILREKKIEYEVIGLQNPAYDRDRVKLERLMRALVPPPPDQPESMEQTCRTQVGFIRIRNLILGGEQRGDSESRGFDNPSDRTEVG